MISRKQNNLGKREIFKNRPLYVFENIKPYMPSVMLLLIGILLLGWVGTTTASQQGKTDRSHSVQQEANAVLDWFVPVYQAIDAASSREKWTSMVDSTEWNTARHKRAKKIYSDVVGHPLIIQRVRTLLENKQSLDELTVRQLRKILYLASELPGTHPKLSEGLIAINGEQEKRLNDFEFCLERNGRRCLTEPSGSDIDDILRNSKDLDKRLRAWEASKEVGPILRDGLIEQRNLRNQIAQHMGYGDFMARMVSNYEMTRQEMMHLMDRLISEVQPLYNQLHCWAKHELALRYKQPVPKKLIPAHWLPNRWAQWWPGLVDSTDIDPLFENQSPQEIMEIAEAFYRSMGFSHLSESFREKSDPYPVKANENRKKNPHAWAFHIDLNKDVRTLMSVEPNQKWFKSAHHELGHIYYYLSYSTPEVPILLREGANRAFHEAIGSQIGMVASQPAYLKEIGLLEEKGSHDLFDTLLDEAFSEYAVVYIPFAAGVMTHFENDLYGDAIDATEINDRWWSYVKAYQGIEPPDLRPQGTCDACTKSHIINDPAAYYDYALAVVIMHQLHRHICQNIVRADVHACSYYQNKEVGEFLRSVMSVGATKDWREVLRDATGEELSAKALVEYFEPLRVALVSKNQGRTCAFGTSLQEG